MFETISLSAILSMFAMRAKVGVVVVLLLLGIPGSSSATAQENKNAALPVVLLIAPTDPSVADDELFRAISAQLSAAPLVLKRHRIPSADLLSATDTAAAAQIVAVTGASMLFWVTADIRCETVYFLPDGSGGRFVRRTLTLEEGTQSSRFEYIALAVSGMIEKFLVTRQLVPIKPKVRESKAVANPVLRKKKWSQLQLVAAYSGWMLGKNEFQHGIYLAGCWVPLYRMVVSLSYTPVFEFTHQNADLTLSITSRIATASLAFRMVEAPIDIQVGVSYVADFRSFATTANNNIFQNENNGLAVISAFQPYISTVWAFSSHAGVYASVGVAVAINETTYQTTFDDSNTNIFNPLIFKLNWNFGGIISF